MTLKPKARVRVVSDRGGMRGTLLVLLWVQPSSVGPGWEMWGCRPVHDSAWDGRPFFFQAQELEGAQ